MDHALEGAAMTELSWPDTLSGIAKLLRDDPGLMGKRDIDASCGILGLSQTAPGRPGDDAAILPDGDDYLLFAIEGFINAFVEADPWFAGWCGIMVNMSDILAMGGRPIAVTDAIWTAETSKAELILEGMRAASQTYDIPIVGGHTNFRAGQSQLAVSILGRAKRLITSFDAAPGDKLIAAIDHRGGYRAPFNNWQAVLDAPAEQLRQDTEVLPRLAEDGLCAAGKDISQGGLVGTSLMLAECSGVAIKLSLECIQPPPGVPLARWLVTFPSFGFLLSAPTDTTSAVVARFQERGIWAAEVGEVSQGTTVSLSLEGEEEVLWDHRQSPYLGLKPREVANA